MQPPIAGLLHAPKKRAAAAQTAMRGCHAAVSAVQSLRSRSLNTQVAAGRASAATRSSSEHDPAARPRAHLRHRGARSDGVVCRNRMRRRLQPAHRRLQPHAPQAATPRIRGCNRMHLRLQPRLQPEAATRGSNRTHLRLQPHAPQVCRGAARLLRRGVLAARRRVLAAAQRLEPRPAAWPAHSGRPAARRRSLQRALAAGVAGWGRLRVPVGAACAPRATVLLPAAASERRGRQPRHAPPWLSGAVASALAIRRASGASWICRAPEAAALLAGAPARWKWPPRCATAWKPHASRTGLCSGTGLLCVVASRVEPEAHGLRRGRVAVVPPSSTSHSSRRSRVPHPRRTCSSSRADWLGHSRCTPSL